MRSSLFTPLIDFIYTRLSCMGGATPVLNQGSDSRSDDFSNAALGPSTSSRWSDLPIDIIVSILGLLELPQALAFASVCKAWRVAATTAGIPPSSTPSIMSWGNHHVEVDKFSSAVTCNLYQPVDVNKSYCVSFPKGCFVECRGASHGWLILANDISNLVLYNPVTLAMIPLPPVTDFTCVKAVSGGYDLEGTVILNEADRFAAWFYQKAVLSCSPSRGGVYVVMIIHYASTWLSFFIAGQSKWQVASTLSDDEYLDCAYHKGNFYAVTLNGMVEKWYLDGANGPTREVLVPSRPHPGCILSRHLVSTPWGDLLQVRAMLASRHPDGIAFEIYKVVPDDGCKVVQENVLVDHAIFIGLNHSACLHTQNLPGIRSRCIYFSAPMTTHAFEFLTGLRVWGGARTYDLENMRFEPAVPCDIEKRLYGILPSEVWITRNL